KRNWLDSDDLAMMYCAAYEPDFYRTLYALVHAEFRARRSARGLARLVAAPWTLAPRHARAAASLAYHGLMLPLLRWRLARRAESTSIPTAPPLLIPLSSPHAAAVPTDQAWLD